ncbi:unnamed protein product, partial [Allacma fusca]
MYSVFGYEALANIDENAMNSEGSAMDNLTSTIITSVDRMMEQKGSTFSENIVKITVFQEEENISGKIAIVTGSYCGLGKQTALELAKRGAEVVLACRDFDKA